MMIQKVKLYFLAVLLSVPFGGICQNTVSIIGVGDSMMGTNYPDSPAGA
jgi:hypothetical protein